MAARDLSDGRLHAGDERARALPSRQDQPAGLAGRAVFGAARGPSRESREDVWRRRSHREERRSRRPRRPRDRALRAHPLVSDIVLDPSVQRPRPIVELFLRIGPDELAGIMNADNAETLQLAAHKLKGTA